MKTLTAVVCLVGLSSCFAAGIGAESREPREKKVEVMCVYYPHWHRYPKGDEWFGTNAWKEGEWEFVKTARPRFPGHKWPMKPLPGYLSGKDPQDVETEIALASNAGIDIFLYDYYYYDGQITQQEAIEEGFLKAKNRNLMKFALMWCYHQRTHSFRDKLGEKKRLLMGRKFVPEELVGLIDYSIAHYFRAPEYWRKDGKLFFSVYNAMDFIGKLGEEGARRAIAEARAHVRAAGLGELEMNAQNVPPDRVAQCQAVGFDSVTHYGYNTFSLTGAYQAYKEGQRLFDYGQIREPLRKRGEAYADKPLPYYPVVPSGWDSSARCDPREPFPWRKVGDGAPSYPYCGIFTNVTPETFECCLRDAKALAERTSGVVYINGWNEYTEGTYLLPTVRDGDAMLRAVGRVFGRRPAGTFVYSRMKKWWEKDAPNAGYGTVEAPTFENVKYGPHLRQAMDVWLPKERTSAKVPALVNIHGGGWSSGDRMCGAESLLAKCRARGFALVTVNYRLIADGVDAGLRPPVRAPLADAVAAIRCIQAHADEWGVDPTRLALQGGSAGACSIVYATLQNDCELGIRSAYLSVPQTSLDPRETREWIPTATYGASAFGYRDFDAWLADRANCLPWIEKFSGAHLLRTCTAAKAPKYFYSCGSFLKPEARKTDTNPTHSPTFCEEFEKIARTKGVACRRGSLDDALAALDDAAYIPEPQPVKSAVEITALYYPGTEHMPEWDMVDQTLPHVKPLLGWYDEGNPEVIDWQIKWAVEHGISSFCVDWYWNRGEQRLDHWVKGYYRAKFRKYLKWYMMYANHNAPGSHSTADQVALSRWWIDRYFKTPEYYTIDGKPAVVVWDCPKLDRDFIAEAAANGETLAPGEGVKRAFAITERMAKEAGLKGVYWIDMYHGWKYEQPKIDFAKRIGCRAQMIYNFDTISYFLAPEFRKPGDTRERFSYDLVAAAVPKWWEMTSRDPAFPFWPMIPTGWNDQPRSFQRARVIEGRTPEKFRTVCESCRAFCEKKGFTRVVIAPVNEWQEGSYIEPNEEYGFGMYDALRDAFCEKPAAGWPKNLTPKDVGRGPYDYPKMHRAAKQDWTFDDGTEGWYRQPYGAPNTLCKDGALWFQTSRDNNFQIRQRLVPFAAQKYRSFRLRMKVALNPAFGMGKGNDAPPRMRLKWGTAEQPIIRKDLSVDFVGAIASAPVKPDGEWHEYALDLAGNADWKGSVDELWFEAVNARHATVSIDWMRFE